MDKFIENCDTSYIKRTATTISIICVFLTSPKKIAIAKNYFSTISTHNKHINTEFNPFNDKHTNTLSQMPFSRETYRVTHLNLWTLEESDKGMILCWHFESYSLVARYCVMWIV